MQVKVVKRRVRGQFRKRPWFCIKEDVSLCHNSLQNMHILPCYQMCNELQALKFGQFLLIQFFTAYKMSGNILMNLMSVYV